MRAKRHDDPVFGEFPEGGFHRLDGFLHGEGAPDVGGG
jgi:hypothetical protein